MNNYARDYRNRVPWGADGQYWVKNGQGYTYTWAAIIFGVGVQGRDRSLLRYLAAGQLGHGVQEE